MDINSTAIQLVEPLGSTVNIFMNTVKVLVGGLFGLYVMMFIYRIFTFRKLSRQMKKLFKELNEIKVRLDKIEKKKKR